MLLAIAINAVIITLLYFPSFKQLNILHHVDLFFIMLFLLEAIVKIRVLKPHAYFNDPWNRFDFILVMLSLPAVLELVLPIPNTSVLLILRLFRLIRLVRFIRFIPHLGTVLKGLGRALKASVFVIIALTFINFLLALFSCHFFQDISPKYFANPLVASYSIFQMFTIEGWNEIPADIATKMDNVVLIGIMRFYFVLVVLIGGIFGLSLANAVFVDEMTIDNTDALEKKVDRLQDQLDDMQEMLRKKLDP
ncbi:MAG: ion transporter [Bacteroidetes bacterium]|nr:ion transporter [Bacteroidota bacterium]